ncbi:RHS repeat domain-containing protein, partial [Vibrio cincinnatiensis]|uniref:RHS repeat domain-containing protein n=1 Tax=Vibrio cincinnatiensis TaxID=675 RepID=UPI001EDE3855
QGNQSQAEGEGQAQHRRFNALNQLVAVENNGGLSHYEYDALGRRSRKITETGITEFIWQGSQLIGEYHQGRYRWYVYQPDSHIPALLLQDGQYYVYQCDHLGTPLRLVTPEGDVVWQAHYETWGEAKIAIERVVNPLRFQGQYYDDETGLHYNLARYYDPRTGRFIQPDPIGLLGGLNHYQYAPNPVMWVDPHGLCAKEESPAIKAGVNDTQPQQPMFYAMGSGNYASAVKTASPIYQLHAIAPDAVQQIGIDYALGATEMLAAGAYNTAVDAVAGLAGLAQLAFGDLEQSSTLIQSIQDKYSYVPQSRGAHQIINNVSGYVEAYADTMEGLGSATLEHTGSPLAATLVQLAPEIVTTAWGGRVAMRSVGKGVVPDKVIQSAQVLQARQRQALMLEDNVGFNISPAAWDSYPTIGRNGTFISDRQGITDIIGDFSGQSKLTLDKDKVLKLEEAFGLERGTLQEGLKIRQVDNIIERMPRSPLEGNQYFLGPGNHLPGGAPEMVIDSIQTVDTNGVTTLLEVLVK